MIRRFSVMVVPVVLAVPAVAQPMMTKSGGISGQGSSPNWSISASGAGILQTLSSSTLIDGTPLSVIAAEAEAALPAVTNPMYASSALTVPSNQCAGNNGPGSTLATFGSVCMYQMGAFPQTATNAAFQPGTALVQLGLDTPSYSSNAAALGYAYTQDNNGNLLWTRGTVGLYPEVRLNAFAGNGWAENPLAQANKDSGVAIVSEMDLNNLSGCDSSGLDRNATGGSAAFIASRSDGTACPNKIGLLITGVAGNTSSAGLAFQYVSDGRHAMWQDGIRMIGGNMAAEYEWISNTAAYTALKIDGVHANAGLDLADGSFAGTGLSLSSDNPKSGGIWWHCPANGCTSGDGQPTSVTMAPSPDGDMDFYGAPLRLYSALITPTIQSPAGSVLQVASNVNLMGNLTGTGNLSTTGGMTASNYGLSSGGNLILINASGAFTGLIGLDGSTQATALSNANGIIVRNTLTVPTIQSPTGTVLQIRSNANFGYGLSVAGTVQVGSYTVATLPTACAAGQVAYATDGRKSGEGAGAGSGTPVICTPLSKGGATAWVPVALGAVAVTN